MRFCSWSTHRNTFYSLLLSSHLFEPDIFCVLFVHSRGQERNSDPRNKGPEFGLLNNFLYLLHIELLCVHFLSYCVQLLFHPNNFHPNSSRFAILADKKGIQIPLLGEKCMAVWWFFTNHFCRGVGLGWGIHYLSYCPHGFGRGCARLAVWAGRPPSRDLHASLVQLWR